MTVTLGTLTTEILDITNRDAATYTSFVNAAIVTAIKYMEAEHPYVYQKTATVTIPQGSNTVALPTDLNQIMYIQYTLQSTIYGMRQGFYGISFDDLLSFFNSTNDTGIPSRYAIFNDALYVYPYTSGDTDFNIFYYYTDQFYPQTPTDTSIWFGDFTIDCVRAKAIENFYRYALQTPDLADKYLIGFNDFLRNLYRRNNSLKMNNLLSI